MRSHNDMWLLGLVVPTLVPMSWAAVAVTGLGVFWWSGPLLMFVGIPLLDYLVGKDSENPPESALAWLEQEGWHIEYDRYARYGVRWLPRRIVARRGEDLDFRFVADRWELP